ncbi:MAG: hypothetical protein HY897_01050 [Deltaproteobacteria bacterium]|nr:hypothetical protein [Deltaproteobacteria bacterium]
MTRTNVILTMAAAVVFAAGSEASAADKKPFSHLFHVSEAGADCAVCHDVKAEKPAIMTTGCADCHDQGAPAWFLPAHHRKSPIAFPHARHAEGKNLACTACHEDVAGDSINEGAPFLPQAKCASCHAGKKVAIPDAACTKCHGFDSKKSPPGSHRTAWRKRHGGEAAWVEKGEHGKDCTLCHGDGACRTCHMQSTPQSHTGLWRVHTHGTAASFDRDRCKTCHETGTCIRCHTNSRPASHVGAWKQVHGLTAGSKDNESCRACHQPGWCAQCHRKK